MKFLQLKEALSQALQKKESAPKPVLKSTPVLAEPPFFSYSTKPSVITDGISREPVDRTAALVISKAPWWAKLIYGTPTKIQSEMVQRRNNSHEQKNYSRRSSVRAHANRGEAIKTKTHKENKPAEQKGPQITATTIKGEKPIVIPKQDREEVVRLFARLVMDGHMSAKKAEELLKKMNL